MPAKTAKKEAPRLSNQELSYQKADDDRKRKDVFINRNVQFIRGPDLRMEGRFSVAEARQREGLAPQTKPPSDEQTNGQIWYNWRTSRSNKRPHRGGQDEHTLGGLVED